MARKVAIVATAVVVALAVYFTEGHRRAERARAVFKTQNAEASKRLPAAPALTVTDLAGNRIETANYTGKVVLVNFWAAWCTPCADEVPKLMELQERYRSQGLEIIGFSMDDTDKVLRDFCAKYKVNYPVVHGSAGIAESYGGILGLPTTVLIGRDGRIAERDPGIANFTLLEEKIVSLLQAH